MTETKSILVDGSDNCIFVEKDIFTKDWKILRTKERGCCASVMFNAKTKTQAMDAGLGIARAIGGIFYGEKDPRKI